MYSGDFNDESRRRARQYGAPEYVVKGSTHPRELLNCIRRHLPSPRSGDTL